MTSMFPSYEVIWFINVLKDIARACSTKECQEQSVQFVLRGIENLHR